MTTPRSGHGEVHASHSIGWLRAAVLGANDGLISTGSLMVGVAAASADTGTVLLTGMAGLIAGALSMAAGEYVSVSSQADVEQADRRKEQRELAEQPELELDELVSCLLATVRLRPTVMSTSLAVRLPPATVVS